MIAPRVRLMRPTERGAVRLLGAALFAGFGHYEAALDRWLRSPAVVTVVADRGQGNPLGFALVGRVDPGGGPGACLLAIGVHDDVRRAGWGRALLASAVAEATRRCARWGVDRLALDVAEDNGGARALFADAGFAEAGPGSPYATGRPSIRLERALG